MEIDALIFPAPHDGLAVMVSARPLWGTTVLDDPLSRFNAKPWTKHSLWLPCCTPCYVHDTNVFQLQSNEVLKSTGVNVSWASSSPSSYSSSELDHVV